MSSEDQNEKMPPPEEPPTTGAPARPAPPTTVVRYGRMGLVGEFSHSPSLKFPSGSRLVIQTDRGIELGEAIPLTCPGCEYRIDREQMVHYAQESGAEYLSLNAGRVLRQATHDDLGEARHLRDSEAEKMDVCARAIETHGLQMKLVDCELLFGGERIIFYFMAEGRIDFRDLVRDLAREFQTRIEMRQVGARDEARLIADYETCGRECCCKNFLKALKPINMKMAKMQKATLDPSKVSGRCGRLKCCLRYEQDTYDELDRRLPRNGTRVRTPEGDGVVIDRLILAQLILVETDANQRVAVPVESATVLEGAAGRRPRGRRAGPRLNTPQGDGPGSASRADGPLDEPEGDG